MEQKQKTRVGRVISNKMDKTIVLAVETPFLKSSTTKFLEVPP